MADKTKFKGGEANQFKVGTFTRNTTLASGNQVISGLGFKPTSVVFFMCQSQAVGEMSTGMDDGTTKGYVADYSNAAPDVWITFAGHAMYDLHSPGNEYQGYVNSFDSGGFTMAWQKIGNPSGTISVIYLAMR